jgi:hypothetical protein
MSTLLNFFFVASGVAKEARAEWIDVLGLTANTFAAATYKTIFHNQAGNNQSI